MKKPRLAKKFLEELRKTPIVSVVCERLGISRQTVYRWKTEDPDFAREFELALEAGRETVTDLAESKLISNINRGDPRSIEYWLRNNSLRYHYPKKPIAAEQPREDWTFTVIQRHRYVDDAGNIVKETAEAEPPPKPRTIPPDLPPGSIIE